MFSAQATTPLHRLRPVRAVVRRWRELTGGTARGRDHLRRTLIACSGGADSSALAIALAARAPEHLVLAHVVHDLRPLSEAEADLSGVVRLAERLSLPMVSTRIRVQGERGNPEAAARRLRYRALAHLAREADCPYVATAHHADDQLETLLMRLIRGAGPAGLAGIHASRPIGEGRECIRPMLVIARRDAEEVCLAGGWSWRHDATNDDRSRLRAALRHSVTPELRRLHPCAAVNAARAAALSREAAEVVARRAGALLEEAREEGSGGWVIARGRIAQESDIILGEVLRSLAGRLLGGGGGDGLGSRRLKQVLAAVRARDGVTRSFTLDGVVVQVDSETVSLRRRTKPDD